MATFVDRAGPRSRCRPAPDPGGVHPGSFQRQDRQSAEPGCNLSRATNAEGITNTMTHHTNPAQKFTRSELVARLVRAGELEVSDEDQAEVDTYFNQESFRFHGPDGFESDYAGLTAYFASIRAAFDDRKITRASSWPRATPWRARRGSRVRSRVFTQSPAGPLPPTGPRVVMDL